MKLLSVGMLLWRIGVPKADCGCCVGGCCVLANGLRLGFSVGKRGFAELVVNDGKNELITFAMVLVVELVVVVVVVCAGAVAAAHSPTRSASHQPFRCMVFPLLLRVRKRNLAIRSEEGSVIALSPVLSRAISTTFGNS